MTEEISFERDIAPLFKLYRAGMLWRFDMTKYEDVKEHARPILARIRNGNMPPPPYPSLTEEEVARFVAWIEQGFPR
ncbi:MAG: hypothetical protein ABL934_06680 [Lysobacteraceae bacterium]